MGLGLVPVTGVGLAPILEGFNSPWVHHQARLFGF